jgi:hypothetical protein
MGLLLAAAALTGCSEHDDTAAPVGQSHAPTPPPPIWARSLIGKRLSDFPSSNQCLGAFDLVRTRHVDAEPGVEVEGWAWLKAEKAAPEHILLVDPGNDVVGAGETAMDRPDVSKAVPEVTAVKVGWKGVSTQTSGQMRAFAALPDGALCPLGARELAR